MGRRPRDNTQQSLGDSLEETPVEEVLEHAKKVNFEDESEENVELKAFERKHRFRLSKGSTISRTTGLAGDEVLHTVARKGVSGHESFLKWVIKNRTLLLECKGPGGLTPLHVAIGNRIHEFVRLVLEHATGVKELLNRRTDLRQNCLHYAITYNSPFTETIMTKLQEKATSVTSQTAPSLPPSNVKGSDGTQVPVPVDGAEYEDAFTLQSKEDETDGMTPLHMAVTKDLEKRSSDSYSPYAVTDRTQTRAGIANIKIIPMHVPENSPAGAQSPVKMLNPKHDYSAAEAADRNPANIKSIRRVLTSDVQKEDPSRARDEKLFVFDLLSIVKGLIKAKPRALVDYRDADGDTPFQARLDYLRSKPGNESSGRTIEEQETKRHEMIDNDPILCYMREFIIDEFDRRDAMKALYKIGDERVLEFDLSGLPYSTINAEFMKGLGKVLRFEGLLKYVALPRLIVEDHSGLGFGERNAGDAGGDKEREQAIRSRGKGLQHMCSIFQWLKGRHVKSVLKITVIDDGEPSHSDEAIERCVDNLDVRIWNWYKVDLCSDVIFNKAKRSRHVILYSSGNNAVLKGWSSPDGLAKLDELSKVHVYVQEGLETRSRTETNMQNFESALKKLKPNKPDLEVTWEFSKPNYNSVFTERSTEKTTESKWMKSMKEFAEFLKTARPKVDGKGGVKPIKIAIIDDGIDTKLETFVNKIQVGESFSRLGEFSGRRGAYYVPSGPHGTLMAQLICEVCPVVKLYIAQLEVLPGLDGRRSFTADSATEAITWAINQGVDIISMSWSINTTGFLHGLENALTTALNDRIIMFCASIDEGTTAVDKTYPGKGGYCIKIGASNGTGAKLSWVSESNSNFLVPGETLQPTASTSASTLGNHHAHIGSFGSSVSTALAAGLAGVLLYCDRLIGTPKVPVVPLGADGQPMSPGVGLGRAHAIRKEVDFLRNSGKMEEAFKNLAKGTEHNKFPQVWDFLPQGTEEEPLVWNTQSEPDRTARTKQKMEDFMNKVKS